MDVAAFAATYGLAALFVIMLLKEIGIPVPVPSDLLMVGAGVQLASGAYSPVALLAALAVAVVVGGSLQYLVARRTGRAVVYRIAAAVGIGAEHLDRAIARITAGGTRAVFVGLNIPGARAAVIPAAGLARFPFTPFTLATLAGSLVFYGWHVALGYLAGPAAGALLEGSAAKIVTAIGALAVVGLVAWVLLRQRTRTGEDAAARSWTEAACPVCLAVTALTRRP